MVRCALERRRSIAACSMSVVVEGVGGWRVPLTVSFDSADLAAEFALPVVIVVANRLGALNHTLLTLESIRARQLPCAGLILNHLPGAADCARRGRGFLRTAGFSTAGRGGTAFRALSRNPAEAFSAMAAAGAGSMAGAGGAA